MNLSSVCLSVYAIKSFRIKYTEIKFQVTESIYVRAAAQVPRTHNDRSLPRLKDSVNKNAHHGNTIISIGSDFKRGSHGFSHRSLGHCVLDA